MSNSPAIRHDRDVELRDPVLIAAFRGWNDAGDAASYAADHLVRVWSAERVASIEPEDFYDFQAVRPQVHLEDGLTRKITWPQNEVWATRREEAPRDALILIGTEPNLRWKTFSKLVVEIAQDHGVGLVLTFGALLADVPHSRPVHITGTAADPALVDRLKLNRSQYEGPTGIVGVLHDAFSDVGVDSASLWAAVPHYLAVNPNPKAALALTSKAMQLTGLAADLDDLRRATTTYERRVSELVAADEDVQAYVRLLEERSDERSEAIGESEIPSGDALATELENFLRGREKPPEESG